MNFNNIHNQELLKNIPLFKTLDHDELGNILSNEKNIVEEYTAKQLIIRQNDSAQCMYVILEGNVEVFLEGSQDDREFTLATLHAGDFFGELALMPDGPGVRNASVRSLHPSKLFRIDKEFVTNYANQHEIKNITPEDEILCLIKKMRLFQSVTEDEFLDVTNWAKLEHFEAGDFVFRESETSERLYVVLEGLIELFVLDDDGKIIIIKKLNRGHFFGEHTMLPDRSNTYNYFSRCDIKSTLVRIEKDFFDKLLARDKILHDVLGKVTMRLDNDINALK